MIECFEFLMKIWRVILKFWSLQVLLLKSDFLFKYLKEICFYWIYPRRMILRNLFEYRVRYYSGQLELENPKVRRPSLTFADGWRTGKTFGERPETFGDVRSRSWMFINLSWTFVNVFYVR